MISNPPPSRGALRPPPSLPPPRTISAVPTCVPFPHINRRALVTSSRAGHAADTSAGAGAAPVVIHNLAAALRETIGDSAADHREGNRSLRQTDNAEAFRVGGDDYELEVHLKFIVITTDAGAASSICTSAEALGLPSKCNFVYAVLFNGTSVTATKSQVELLLANHASAVSQAEAALEVTVAAIQNDPPWGLDRIDVLSAANEYEYDPDGALGARVFVVDTGVRARWARCRSEFVLPWYPMPSP